MLPLGVFTQIYGENPEMTMSRALLVSLVGFLIVFLILSVIALFVKLMGKVFERINPEKTEEKAPVKTFTSLEIPLPENCSQGNLVLENVTEEEAVVIMAIVSKQSGIPLNRLKFNSIKLKGEI